MIAWIVAEAIYIVTGNSLPVEYYVFPDIFVLTVILCKAEYQCLWPYDSLWHQLKCVVLERSPADRIIMLIFPVMWALYIAELHPYYKWWALYFFALAQFFAAGWEAFSAYRRDKAAVHSSDGPSSGAEYSMAYGRADSG